MAQSTIASIHEMLPIFSTIFSRDKLKEMLAEMDIKMYWRSYTPLVVLWGFLYQRLQNDHTCDNYVAYLHSGQADQLDPHDEHEEPLSYRLRSESNSAYVQGRNRLPLALMQEGMRLVNQQIQSWLGAEGAWRGHAVRFIDGTTFTLQQQGDLAATYGHGSNQRGESYWVKVRSVASFDLVSQAAVAVVEAPYSTGETSLVHPVLSADPQPGAIYVGDRNFGVYRVLQAVKATGMEGLFRLQKQQWKSLLKRNGIGHLQAGESRPCVWPPSNNDQLLAGLPAPAIAGRLLYVRLERDGFPPKDLYLFTTLRDETCYPIAALANLYALRYKAAEVDFRHVKVTMQLDYLPVRSAEMLRKELLAGFLAYNLVRALMTLAAMLGQQELISLSFAQSKRRLCHALFAAYPQWVCVLKAPAKNLYRRLNACRLPSQLKKVKHEPRRKRYKQRPYPPLKTDRVTARRIHLQQIMEVPIS